MDLLYKVFIVLLLIKSVRLYCGPYNGQVCKSYSTGYVWYNDTGGLDNEKITTGLWKEMISHLKEPCRSKAEKVLCAYAFPKCIDKDGVGYFALPLCYEDCMAIKMQFCYNDWIVVEEQKIRGVFFETRGHFRLPECEKLPRFSGRGSQIQIYIIMTTEERLVTEVPSSLKQLARLVVRGFYTIEDALIVDMLVRNPCMKEDDICELLKFERKMLRARISTLKNDKFIQVRLKMETGPDGKAQKVNYYFINYKTFVNVVKYKLDLMRKRMETEERDATSRASFKCPACGKTFTDLEADQLYDMLTQEFRCTFCNQVVEEDQSALPKKDSRLLLAKFNEQLETLYILLREVEGIKLAPEILEPEPVDINTIRGLGNKQPMPRPGQEQWSGEATRNQGMLVEETRVDVTIGELDHAADAASLRKERPVWMVESTIVTNDQSDSAQSADAALEKAASNASSAKAAGKEKNDDIMSVLLAHEKQNTGNATTNALKGIEPESSDSSDNESKDPYKLKDELAAVAEMESEDSDSDDNAPTVLVNGKAVPLTSIDDDVIAQMTPTEKETYIQVYQEYYSHMYD